MKPTSRRIYLFRGRFVEMTLSALEVVDDDVYYEEGTSDLSHGVFECVNVGG